MQKFADDKLFREITSTRDDDSDVDSLAWSEEERVFYSEANIHDMYVEYNSGRHAHGTLICYGLYCT